MHIHVIIGRGHHHVDMMMGERGKGHADVNDDKAASHGAIEPVGTAANGYIHYGSLTLLMGMPVR